MKNNLRTWKLLGFWWIKGKHRKLRHTLKLFALGRTGQQVLVCDGCGKIRIVSYFEIYMCVRVSKLEAMNSFMYAISVEVNY